MNRFPRDLWPKLTPDERRLFHVVYDRPPWTDWEPVLGDYFIRFHSKVVDPPPEGLKALADMTMHLTGRKAWTFAVYTMKPEARTALGQKLRKGLERAGVVHGGKAPFLPEDARLGRTGTCKITDDGWLTLGLPRHDQVLKLDYEAAKGPWLRLPAATRREWTRKWHELHD